MVVTLVANVLEKMAKGLKASFGQYRNIVAHQILDRMKEKKTNVLEALRAALDALIASVRYHFCSLTFLAFFFQ